MTDAPPAQIAAALMADTYATPATILVAIDDDPELVVLREDVAHLGTLERSGCLSAGKVTSFGQQVATVLRTVHEVQA